MSFEPELQATSHFVFFWSFLYPFNVIISPIWTRFFIYQRIVSLNTYANTEFSNAQSSGPQTGAPRKESLTVPVTVTSESQAPLPLSHRQELHTAATSTELTRIGRLIGEKEDKYGLDILMNFELKPRVDDTAKGSQASGANRPSSSHLSSHLTSPPTSSKETSEILQEAVLKLQSSSVNINHPHHHLHHLH